LIFVKYTKHLVFIGQKSTIEINSKELSFKSYKNIKKSAPNFE